MFRRLLAVFLLLSSIHAHALSSPQVFIDEAFDASRGIGSFGIINASNAVIVAFAVGNDTATSVGPSHEFYRGWGAGIIEAADWDAALPSIQVIVSSTPTFADAFPGYQTALVYWANDLLTVVDQNMVAALGWRPGTLAYDGRTCAGFIGCRNAVMPGDDMSHATFGELGFWFSATSANSPFLALAVDPLDQTFTIIGGMTTPVPEPGAMLLMLAGLLVVSGWMRCSTRRVRVGGV